MRGFTKCDTHYLLLIQHEILLILDFYYYNGLVAVNRMYYNAVGSVS